MSVCRKLPDGTVQKIAGHTILLDANASEVRSGTGHLTKRPGNQFMDSQVTFSDPMPDTDYAVDISFVTEHGISALARVQQKTVTGFKLEGYITNSNDADMYGDGGWDFKYIAWKPVKIEGYTALQNKVNNPDDTPTIDSMNLVTSDGVARAIENASAVWKGTKAEWNALPAADKIKYDLAVLLDQTLVKAIDRTDGTETNVADLSGQFVGTHAEWEAESNKTQYKTAVLTDERKTVNEVTGTGALNEVADDARIWRGTKEEWEALTDAEKDEWDQAEIETIEAQGLNPFRTLSDPEELSLAPETEYTCPHDGFINISSGPNNGYLVYVNGKLWGASAATAANNKNSHTVPVQQGDVVKYTNTLKLCTVMARWYTTDINPGNPIDYPVVHRSQSLDWGNKVVITGTDLVAGWTAPSDGYFFSTDTCSSNDWIRTYINGVQIMYTGTGSGNFNYTGAIQCPVTKGDVVSTSSTTSAPYMFVPYKDYPDYSTTEHWTGRRWIDGKKIYSRVFTGLSFNGNILNWINTGVNVPGIERVIKCDGWRETTCIVYTASPNYSGEGSVYVHGHVDGLDPTDTLYIEYTKTTDD